MKEMPRESHAFDGYGPLFDKSDFDLLKYDPSEDAEPNLQQLGLLKERLEVLNDEAWSRFGTKHYADRRSGKIQPRNECLWFGYYMLDKPNASLTDFPNLNFTLNQQGIRIDVNAETRTAFNRSVRKIRNNPYEFNKVIEKPGSDVGVDLYTKLPLRPCIANVFYWKHIAHLSDSIDAQRIIEKVDDIEENFVRLRSDMVAEVGGSPKYSDRDLNFVRKHYLGTDAKTMNPLSFCVIRFNHTIDKQDILDKGCGTLAQQIVDVSKNLHELAVFLNT